MPVLAIASVAVVGLVALPRALAPSLSRDAVRIARVERGDVVAVVEASGVVVPESERLVTSPVEARLLRVMARPGDVVKAGDPLVELDAGAARVELARLTERVESLEIARAEAELARDRARRDVEARLSSRRLEASAASARLARARRLHDEGIISAELLDERELEVARANLDVAELERSLRADAEAARLRAEGLSLQLQQAAREREEHARQLSLADSRAEAPGVVTWVLDEPGRAVARGDVLARIASVETLRVRGTVSDSQARRVTRGMPVRVRFADFEIAGVVESVAPAVENGVLGFDVVLAERSEWLKPSLRVDAWVVRESRRNALRIPPGASTRGLRATVFVVEDGVARPREVSFGLAGPDAVEILAGLREGEEVIVSDMSDVARARKVRIR